MPSKYGLIYVLIYVAVILNLTLSGLWLRVGLALCGCIFYLLILPHQKLSLCSGKTKWLEIKTKWLETH